MKHYISRLAILELNTGTQFFHQQLLMAEDEAGAQSLNDLRASVWGGDSGVKEAESTYVFSTRAGEFQITAHAVQEILPSTFEELQNWLGIFGDTQQAVARYWRAHPGQDGR